MAAAAAAADAEAFANSKSKKGETKKKKKKKKGGGEAVEKEESNTHKIGPNELVRKFDDFYDDYNEKWAARDESDNFDQKYDKLMAREEVMPQVSKNLLGEVDEAIK